MKFTLDEFVDKAPEWCNVKRVPADKRAPTKLLGLFWMKDFILGDVAYCANLGRWDSSTRTLTVPIYESFVFWGSHQGKIQQDNTKGVVHRFIFSSSKLDHAIIKPGGGKEELDIGGLPTNKLGMTLLGKISKMEMREEPAEHPGDKWDRPNELTLGPIKKKGKLTNYKAWRLMDGKGRKLPDNVAAFHKDVQEKKRKEAENGLIVYRCVG